MKDTKTTVCGLTAGIAAAMLAVPGLPPWLTLTLKLMVAASMGTLGFFAKDRPSGIALLTGGLCLGLAGCAVPPWLHVKVNSPTFGSVEVGLHPGAIRSTNEAQPKSLP